MSFLCCICFVKLTLQQSLEASALVAENGYTPRLDLKVPMQKKISSIVAHLRKKWINKKTQECCLGALRVFPAHSPAHPGWTLSDKIKIQDILDVRSDPATTSVVLALHYETELNTSNKLHQLSAKHPHPEVSATTTPKYKQPHDHVHAPHKKRSASTLNTQQLSPQSDMNLLTHARPAPRTSGSYSFNMPGAPSTHKQKQKLSIADISLEPFENSLQMTAGSNCAISPHAGAAIPPSSATKPVLSALTTNHRSSTKAHVPTVARPVESKTRKRGKMDGIGSQQSQKQKQRKGKNVGNAAGKNKKTNKISSAQKSRGMRYEDDDIIPVGQSLSPGTTLAQQLFHIGEEQEEVVTTPTSKKSKKKKTTNRKNSLVRTAKQTGGSKQSTKTSGKRRINEMSGNKNSTPTNSNKKQRMNDIKNNTTKQNKTSDNATSTPKRSRTASEAVHVSVEQERTSDAFWSTRRKLSTNSNLLSAGGGGIMIRDITRDSLPFHSPMLGAQSGNGLTSGMSPMLKRGLSEHLGLSIPEVSPVSSPAKLFTPLSGEEQSSMSLNAVVSKYLR